MQNSFLDSLVNGLRPVAIDNPLSNIKLEPWQVKPWEDRSHTMLLTGSAGGGKSHLAASKIVDYCCRYPGSTALVIRKTRQSVRNSTVLLLERKIIRNNRNIVHLPSKNRFDINNGSMIVYGGMADEKQREDIRSVGQDGGVDIVFMEEANRFFEDDYNEILARLRGKAGPYRQIIVSTNPDSPHHWIYKRLILGKEATVYLSSAKDNSHNPAEYIANLNKLMGILRKRLVEGLWVQSEGVVYEDWNPTVHMIEPFEIPSDWRRVRVIDFGYSNAFTCQWWAIDPDDRMYLYREIYHTKRIVSDHAKHIKQLSEGETYVCNIADHDAEDRATLNAHGIYTIAAKKEVSVGIQEVQQRLRIAGDGKPRLYVFSTSLVETDRDLEFRKLPTCLVEEIPGYVWAVSKDGRAKEEPVKLNDHGIDAMRYMANWFNNKSNVTVATSTPKPDQTSSARPSVQKRGRVASSVGRN